MMPYLPLDVVEEILCRLPAASLKRLRSTCKKWNALYKDPRFIEKHFCKASKQFLVLIIKEFKVSLMSVNLNVAPPTIEFKGPLGLKDSYSISQVDIIHVFHCSGLLLCTTKNDRLLVWNPCLRETRWIQLKTGNMINSMFSLGYENKKTFHSYKILRYGDIDNDDPKQGVVGSEIYELSSDSWKVLDDLTLEDCYTLDGASLKGNTYFISLHKRDNSVSLLSFDFTTERYRRLGLLPLQSTEGFMDLSVVKEEELSFLYRRNHSSKIDIWVTNKIATTEAAVLWRKSFTVDLYIHDAYFPFSMTFLIDVEKKVVVYCNAGFETCRKKKMIYIIGQDHECYAEFPFVKSTSNSWYPIIFNYLPSLVSVQQGIIETIEDNET